MFKGIMLNEDDSHFWYTRYPAATRSDIEEFVDQYAGTQVTDFILCCAGRNLDYPSKVRESYVNRYLQTEQNGKPVNFKETFAATMYNAYVRDGLDFYGICVERFRSHGIRPWLSVRMNDCHDNAAETSVLHTDYFLQHPELRRVRHRPPKGYFDRCYDYECPEIYDMMLATVEEIAMRYDADGIELDWQREMHCFQIGHEHAGIETLNRFTRDVRAILDRAGEKWGRRVKLCVRTLADPELALEAGFDVVQWAREGLIDVVVPTPRWASIDNDIPVELWKRLLYGLPVELAVGAEILLRTNENGPFYANGIDNISATAAAYLTSGADKLYLFNYFDRERVREQYPEDCLLPGHYETVLNELGDTETAVARERRHVVTFRDVGPVWNDRRYLLPLESAGAEDVKFLRVRTGEIPAGAKLELRVASDEPFEPFVNSRPVRYLREETVSPPYTALPARVYEIENDGQMPPFLVVELSALNAPAKTDYVEIHVIP